MKFQNPEFLLLLFLLVPVIFFQIWKLHKSEASLQVSSLQNMKKYGDTLLIKLRYIPFFLRILAITCIILVIARPTTFDSWKTQHVEAIDIMMLLDISGTMEVFTDFTPNRLEASKLIGIEFIKSRPNDHIGLVIFAGKSFTQCPLTRDHASLISLFETVKYGLIEDGTAIGVGIANAVARLKDGPSKSKVIILTTDGVNNMGNITPKMAAEIAQLYGIKIYIIGVGSYGEFTIPYDTPLGVRYYTERDVFEEEILKEIAELTGAAYFRATDNDKMKKIYQEIDAMEKTKIKVREFRKKQEVYHIFAFLAFVFLGLEIFIRNTILRPNP